MVRKREQRRTGLRGGETGPRKAVGKFVLKLGRQKNEVAYLQLPGYPKSGACKMSRSVRLFDIIGQYDGPDVILDFDENNVLVGIELLV